MSGLLALLLLVVPVVELFLIVQVASYAGALNTIVLLIGISIAGTMLIRWQGMELARRLTATVRQGRIPRDEAVDGGLILLAGALLVTPGFLSDVLGLLLLLPPVRALIRPAASRAVRRMATPGPNRRVRVWTNVVDVDERPAPGPTAGSRSVLDVGSHERRTEPDGR